MIDITNINEMQPFSNSLVSYEHVDSVDGKSVNTNAIGYVKFMPHPLILTRANDSYIINNLPKSTTDNSSVLITRLFKFKEKKLKIRKTTPYEAYSNISSIKFLKDPATKKILQDLSNQHCTDLMFIHGRIAQSLFLKTIPNDIMRLIINLKHSLMIK